MTISSNRPREIALTYSQAHILNRISQLNLRDQLRPDSDVFHIFEEFPEIEIRQACLRKLEPFFVVCGPSVEYICDWVENCIQQLKMIDSQRQVSDRILPELLDWYLCKSSGDQRVRAINFVLEEVYFKHDGLGSKQLAAALKNSDQRFGDIGAQTYNQIQRFEAYVLEEFDQVLKHRFNGQYSERDWFRTERGLTVMLSYSQVACKLLPTFIERIQHHLAHTTVDPLRPIRLDADQAYAPSFKAAQHTAAIQAALEILNLALKAEQERVAGTVL